jgi:hypothetical protein
MTSTAVPKATTRDGRRGVTIAWIVLCALTAGSWWLSPARSATPPVASLPITAAVIVLGFVKCRLVIRYFMEVKTAPRWLRLATDGWLAVLWVAVLVIYLY